MSERTFPMSDDEISVSFRTAASPHKQVQVLADLNCCSKGEMMVKLQELGLLEELPAPTAAPPVKAPAKASTMRRPKRWDDVRAMELYKEGLTDLDIAECVGVTKSTIGSWRREKGLPPNMAPFQPCTASPPLKHGMTIQRLQRLLDAIAAGHPDALVFADGCSVIGVDVLVCMDADGKTQSSRISFRTEE